MFALVGYPSVNSSWPHFQLPEFRVSVQDYDVSPSNQIFKVYTYCRVLQRNQGVVLLNVYPGLDLTYLAPFFTSSMELIFYFPKDRFDLMGKCVPLGTALDAVKVLKKCNVQRLNYLSFSAKDRNATLFSKDKDDWSVFENIPVGCIHFRVGSVDEEVLDRLNVVLGLREIQFQRSYSVLSCTFLRDCRFLESVQFIDPRLDFSSVKRLKNALRSLTTSLRYVEFVRIRTKGGLCGFILECGIELELESVGWQSQILAEDGSSVRWEKNY